MTSTPYSRRGFFAAAIAGTAAAWLATHAREIEAAMRAGAAAGDPWKVLTPEQAATLDAVTAQIVPSEGGIGAREAHVVPFIDNMLATAMKDDGPQLAPILEALEATTKASVPTATSFVACTSEQQIQVLQALEKAHPEAFGPLRMLTIAGMFTNPSYGGNFEKSGWKMLGFEDKFFWTPPFGWYDRV